MLTNPKKKKKKNDVESLLACGVSAMLSSIMFYKSESSKIKDFQLETQSYVGVQKVSL
jgi:hypothetical protein